MGCPEQLLMHNPSTVHAMCALYATPTWSEFFFENRLSHVKKSQITRRSSDIKKSAHEYDTITIPQHLLSSRYLC